MIDDLWYQNSIIYSLDLDTFMDGNGDGVGDLPGLIDRMDYLNSLGVDVIWLAPLLGFEYLYLHQVDLNQQGFIEAFSKHVLPQLR